MQSRIFDGEGTNIDYPISRCSHVQVQQRLILVSVIATGEQKKIAFDLDVIEALTRSASEAVKTVPRTQPEV